MMKILLADDELHVREKLSGILNSFSDVKLVGICSGGKEAVDRINEAEPDLLFLDIQMPGLNGFEVINELETRVPPFIVFITAYTEYAFKAFEYEALDYIHKPFDRERVRKAVDKVQALRKTGNHLQQEENSQLVQGITAGNSYLKRFLVKKNNRLHLVETDDIFWVESDGNYLHIVTGGQKYIIRHTMTAFQDLLDPDLFFRTHRSYIVNIEKVDNIEEHTYGNYIIHMQNGSHLKMSKNYREILDTLRNF